MRRAILAIAAALVVSVSASADPKKFLITVNAVDKDGAAVIEPLYYMANGGGPVFDSKDTCDIFLSSNDAGVVKASLAITEQLKSIFGLDVKVSFSCETMVTPVE